LLNAKLSDLAETLRETEMGIWRIFFDWQASDMPRDFEVYYPESFDIRDKHSDLELFLKARSSGVTDPLFQKYISKEIVDLLVEDSEDIEAINNSIDASQAPIDIDNLGG